MWVMSSSICGINMRSKWPENKKKIQEKLCYVTYGPFGRLKQNVVDQSVQTNDWSMYLEKWKSVWVGSYCKEKVFCLLYIEM
jgi:hypothetical protein